MNTPKTIQIVGRAALVEYEGRRAWVPVAEAGNPEAMARGIPYGVDWERVIAQAGGMQATPQALAGELRARGIWTAEDLQRNLSAARGAIQAVYGLDLATLVQAAKRV
jgi:hypothetical protein